MKQAIYSASHDIHFGLASEGYTHFTSPIRRYPDLVVHRMLRMALRVENKLAQRPGTKEMERIQKELEEICEHCSYRERLAADAERESIRLKQVRAMVTRVGDEFKGKVVGIIESGFFVQVNDPYVEGMVSQESLQDDFYQFNEERMIYYGTRKKRTFRIGQEVEVLCLRADLDERRIEFGLAEFGIPEKSNDDEGESRPEAPVRRFDRKSKPKPGGARGSKRRRKRR